MTPHKLQHNSIILLVGEYSIRIHDSHKGDTCNGIEPITFKYDIAFKGELLLTGACSDVWNDTLSTWEQKIEHRPTIGISDSKVTEQLTVINNEIFSRTVKSPSFFYPTGLADVLWFCGELCSTNKDGKTCYELESNVILAEDVPELIHKYFLE